jgi:hypothetical protein
MTCNLLHFNGLAETVNVKHEQGRHHAATDAAMQHGITRAAAAVQQEIDLAAEEGG